MNEKELLIKLGLRLKELRKSKGLSQEQLAANCGKDQQSIQRMESGKHNPSYIYLIEFCNGLEVSLVELFIGL